MLIILAGVIILIYSRNETALFGVTALFTGAHGEGSPLDHLTIIIRFVRNPGLSYKMMLSSGVALCLTL